MAAARRARPPPAVIDVSFGRAAAMVAHQQPAAPQPAENEERMHMTLTTTNIRRRVMPAAAGARVGG